MATQKITGPESSEMTGFVIVDLDGADHADGVVRCAKKILMDGARTMARSRTYSWALLGHRRSGASAAINVAPTERDGGIAAFIDAVTDRVRSGELSLDAAKGIAPEELASLTSIDARSPLHDERAARSTLADELVATSAATSAAVALGGTGGLAGRTVAIEGAGTMGPALVDAVTMRGATVVAIGTTTGTLADPAGLDPAAIAASWTEHGESLPGASGSDLSPDDVLRAPADVLFCGSKVGLVDHVAATALATTVLSPIGVAPVTAKALAVAARSGVIVLPDFLTLSGSLHSFVAGPEATADSLRTAATERSSELTAAALAHDEGPYLGACALAETFLSGWRDELPFGRPLA